VRDEHRQLEALEDVILVELPTSHRRADLRRHHHVEGEHVLEIVRRRLSFEAAVKELSRGGDVGGEILG